MAESWFPFWSWRRPATVLMESPTANPSPRRPLWGWGSLARIWLGVGSSHMFCAWHQRAQSAVGLRAVEGLSGG